MRGVALRAALLAAPFLFDANSVEAQQFGRPQLDESYTFNEPSFRPRPPHYLPDGGGVVTFDGPGRFNRALYGAHTGFRVECSDTPEFGIYLPGMGGNLCFEFPAGSCTARYTAGRMDYAQGGVTLEVQVLRVSDLASDAPGAPDTFAVSAAPHAAEARANQNGRSLNNSEKAYFISNKDSYHSNIARTNRENGPTAACGGELPPALRGVKDAALWRLRNTTDRVQRIGVRFGGVSGKKFYRNGDLGVDDPHCFDFKPEDCATNAYRIDGAVVRVSYEAKAKGEVTLIIPLSERRLEPTPHLTGVIELPPHGERLVAYVPQAVGACSQHDPALLLTRAERERSLLAGGMRIETPDPRIDPIAGALCIAADGIWSGRTWLHGAVGWRTEHLGWRGAYAGDAIGRHDRARTHFVTYAANQVTDVEPCYDHPRLDSALNLARAEKRWGTPMYSNGYICRRPGRREMSHYDMNLVYIDALLRHLRATGDTTLMRQLFPVIERHLQWEKRNFDPDGDHLYDAYCCIWASDALFYGGGAVAHSSAYNLYAYRETARIAERLGLDPTPYREEAKAIRRAMHEQLWDAEGLHWGEYRDATGHRRLHTAAALWTVYHTIDSEAGDSFEAAATACYALEHLPQIPVREAGRPEVPGLCIPATTTWQPYAWSINNVAIAEAMHAALAYWQAGWSEEAFALMKSVALDNMYLGASPLNFGQLSYLDAARGECYRDFADPIGVWARALVEGLFGIRPDLLGAEGRVELRPGFPAAWDRAAIELPDIAYRMQRDSGAIRYTIENRYPAGTRCELVVPVGDRRIKRVTVDGRKAAWERVEPSFGTPRIRIALGAGLRREVCIETRPQSGEVRCTGETWGRAGGLRFVKYETADGLAYWVREGGFETGAEAGAKAGSEGLSGARRVSEAGQTSLAGRAFEAGQASSVGRGPGNSHRSVPGLSKASGPSKVEKSGSARRYRTIDISRFYNACVTDIYRNAYRSNRSGTTTLQIPLHGFGEWCHPTDTVAIDDSGLRRRLLEKRLDDRTGLLTAEREPLRGRRESGVGLGDGSVFGNGTGFGNKDGSGFGYSSGFGDGSGNRAGLESDTQRIPFRMAHTGPNICYTSLWKQYPDRLAVPLSGRGRQLIFVLAGSTNPMQCRIENGIVRVRYADGSSAEPLAIVNPDTWAPVEQIAYHDGHAFRAPFDRQHAEFLPLERLHLGSGKMSRYLDRQFGIEGVGARYIEGGAAVVLQMPVDPAKELAELELETLSNDVVIGLMAVTVEE